jgi:hypothetical protein
MAGGRAVALVYNDDKGELMRRMKSVNMLIFPGGAASLEASSPFFKSAKWMFEMALKFNTNGDYFPVHGTRTLITFYLNTFPQHILSVLICTTHLGGRHVSWL